mgnify:CR=1 FL=1
MNNLIRSNFERAMNIAAINEAVAVAKLEILAQSPSLESKKELFDTINNVYFGGKSPFGDRLVLNKIDQNGMQQVYNALNKDMKAANMLFELKKTGIGGGEILMAYLVENMIIGGGSADIDLNLFDMSAAQKGKFSLIDSAELKEASMTKDGFLKDWRTGAKHRNVINRAIEELKRLYAALVNNIPELNPSTPYGKEAERKARMGEWTQVVNVIKDIDPVEINTVKIDVTLQKGADGNIVVSRGGQAIGNINDSKTIKILDNLLQDSGNMKLMSFNDIETQLAIGFGGINEKFVFIVTRGATGKKSIQSIHYKDSLPGNSNDLKIYHITQNTIKVKVKA